MAHGTKDYGNVSPKDVTYRLDDLAELAVRLGAVPSLDRLGEVIFIDGFESGLDSWLVYDNEGLATISLTGTQFKTGGFSCKMVSPEDYADFCYIAKGSAFFLGGKIGFEYSFSGDIYGKQIGISIYIFNGTDLLQGIIVYDVVAQTLSYFNTLGEWVVFQSDLKIVQGDYLWNTWKMVIDIDTETYVRIRVNQNTYNLPGISLLKSASATSPYISVMCMLQETQDTATTLYIDDCILTQNEP